MKPKDLGEKTPFYDRHVRHGAHLVNFFGFAMPLQYTSIVAEHLRVRSTVGMFDLSHMGEIFVSGPEALAFVQKMTVNDAAKLAVGQAQYSAMCYPHGGIVDDLVVYRLEDGFLLVVNAANVEKDFRWLMDHRDGRVTVADESEQYALLAVQGPRAQDVLAQLTPAQLEHLGFYHFLRDRVVGLPMIISRTGYTGEDGFELYLEPPRAPQLWDAVLEAGKKFQLEPVGLGARDSLRLEMKYLLYGQDIDQTTTPLEAGLGWITKLDKGDFIGRPTLLEQRQKGPARRLVAFEMLPKAIPRPGYDLMVDGQSVGRVASGVFSPSLNKGIGTGYLPIQHAEAGTRLEVIIRGQPAQAQVVKPPFYGRGTHR